jgi:hypothetical protein
MLSNPETDASIQFSGIGSLYLSTELGTRHLKSPIIQEEQIPRRHDIGSLPTVASI